MQVRQFIIKTFLLLLLVILFDFIGGSVFSYLQTKATEHSPYGMVADYTMNKVKSDVVIIGSSRAQHHYNTKILEDSLGMSVYNCGRDGSFFLYQTAMINGLLDRYSPKIIIWDFEPVSYLQASNQSIQTELDRLSDLFAFYDSDEYIQKIVLKRSKFEKIKLFSNLYQYNSRLMPLLYKSFMPDYKYYRGYAPIATTGYIYPQKKKVENKEPFSKSCFTVFKETLEKCKKKGVKIVLCFSPRYVEDNYQSSRSYQTITALLNEMKIPLLDYNHRSVFMNDSTNFKDNIHLNSKGALVFTELVSENIKVLTE